MKPPYQAAADEIFREVVNGPETSGPREIVAILEKHFAHHFKPPGRSLSEMIAETDDDDDDSEPLRSRVISAL